MNAYIEFRVGDRVVAETASFGRVTGRIVKIVFGDYLHIRSEANGYVYGVHEGACRRATEFYPAHREESENEKPIKRFLRISAELR
jgi:hypothetical protein